MSRDALRSILVASDLSGSSDPVVRAAAELAEQTGAALHVLHAVEVQGRPFWEAASSLIQLQSVMHEARSELEEQLRRMLPSAVATGSVKLDYQAASTAILERAKKVDADLIVVGPHRARIAGSDILGTTAQRVVEEATIPCLVARKPLPSPLRRVLLPVGEIDVRRGLLAAAGHWLTKLREEQAARASTRQATELRVLHVVEAASEWGGFSGELAREIRALSERTEFESHIDLNRSVVWSKSPATEIVHVAEEVQVDLIAMGVRGHGPLMRAVVGSVSSAVLRQASAPVLLFPPRMCETWASRAGSPAADAAEFPGDVRPLELTPEVRGSDALWRGVYLGSDEDEIEISGASLNR